MALAHSLKRFFAFCQFSFPNDDEENGSVKIDGNHSNYEKSIASVPKKFGWKSLDYDFSLNYYAWTISIIPKIKIKLFI